MRVTPEWINPFRPGFDSKICLVNPNSFLKNIRFYQWFSIFFMSRTPKIRWNLAAGPSSQNVLFQGQPPRKKDLSENPIRCEYIFKHVHAFSKIADLQARSAALGAVLRACRSAVFQRLKHKIMVKVVKR